MDRLGCTINTETNQGSRITSVRCQNGFWRPNKTTTVDKNGVITIDHKYADGLNVIKRNDGKGFKVISISHDNLRQPLYLAPSEKLQYNINTNGMVISEESLKIYRALPATLKKICAKSMSFLADEALKALGGFNSNNIKTTYNTYYIDKDKPVTIIESKLRGSGDEVPYKRTIIHSNGTVIVNHKYRDGLYVSREKLSGNSEFEITYVSKNGVSLYNKYCPEAMKDLRGLKQFTDSVSAAYESLPTHLKKVCAKTVKFLLEKPVPKVKL